MKNKGFIHIYTGDGKGKTTAVIGLAVRAAGQGRKVAFLQFLKYGNFSCGEENILKTIKNIKFIKFNEESPIFNNKLKIKKLKLKAKEHILKSVKMINSGKFDLVILDEVTYHFKFRIFSVKEFFKKIKNRPYYVEVIITGRYPIKELINRADLVTEMKKIKHPFDKGIKAKKGIDY